MGSNNSAFDDLYYNDERSLEETAREVHENLHRVSSSKDFWEFHSFFYLDIVEQDAEIDNLVNYDILNDKGETPLHLASFTNFYYVRVLLYYGANPHIRNFDGQTALHYAARAGCIKTVELLLKKRVDINLLDYKGRSALYEAVKYASMPVVKLLLKKGANFNAKSMLLGAALESKNLQMLDFILRLDGAADVKTENPDGTSPLHFAVHLDIPASMPRYMIRQGADVNKQDGAGVTVLHHALRWGSFEHVKLLVDKGADVSIRDSKGQSTLHYAVLSAESAENVIKKIKYLMELGEKLSVASDEGSTLLHGAATNPDSALLYFVLEYSGRHVDERDATAQTALHHAAKLGNVENCELLLRHGGADVNVKCVDDRSPLSYAIDECHTSTVKLLLRHGAGLQSEELLRKRLLRADLRKSELTLSLVRHLAKIHQSDGDCGVVQENDWTLIKKRPELEEYFWASVSEFKRMGEIELFKDVTLRDIASKSEMKLTSYARNEELVKNYEEKFDETEYSIFAKDLARFKRKIVRQRLLVRAVPVFNGFRILNEELNERILDFLTDDDLRYFLGDFRKFLTHASLEATGLY